MGDGAEGHDFSLRSPDIYVVQVHRRLPVLRFDFQHNVVLVDGGIHGGNLGLAEGFVERVVEHLRGDAEARSGGTVIGKHGLKTAVLLVGIDVGEEPQFPHLLEKHGTPLHQVL
jgi:hypothetical protein